MAIFTDDTGISTTISDGSDVTGSSPSDRGIVQYNDSNINVFDVNALVLNDVQLSSVLVISGITDSSGSATSFTDDTGIANNITDD